MLDLWQRDRGEPGGDRATARLELLSTSGRVTGWYEQLGASLAHEGAVPDAADPDPIADSHLVDAVRRDLTGADGQAGAVGVRILWTGDQLDAVRRLQAGLVEPARAVTAASSRLV